MKRTLLIHLGEMISMHFCSGQCDVSLFDTSEGEPGEGVCGRQKSKQLIGLNKDKRMQAPPSLLFTSPCVMLPDQMWHSGWGTEMPRERPSLTASRSESSAEEASSSFLSTRHPL